MIFGKDRDWRRMRRCDDPSNDLGPLWSHQSCPGCIIATRGYDFREGQAFLQPDRALFFAKTSDGTMRSTNWQARCCAQAGRLLRASLCCRAGFSIELVQKAGMIGIIVGV